MENQDLKAKAFNAFAWGFFGKVAKQGVTFIISVFLARLLSPSDFGLVGMATVFISLTQSFSDFGLTNALVQKKEVSEIEYNTVFYINIVFSIVLMMLMILCSSYIAEYYGNEEVGKIVRFVSYTFVIYALNGVQNAQLSKRFDIKTRTIANISGALVAGIIGIILALTGYKVWSLVYSSLCGGIITTAVIWYSSNWRPKLLFRLSEIKELFSYGYKLFLTGFIDTFYSKIDVLIIGRLFSPNILGLFYRAQSFNQFIVRYSADSLSGVFFPVISKLQDNKQRLSEVANKSFSIICFLTFGLMGIMYVTAEPLIILLFGEKWLGCVEYFKLLVFSAYLFPTRIILINILNGIGLSGTSLKVEIYMKIFGFLAIGIGFIFGIEGYLWGLAISAFCSVLIMMYYVDWAIQWSIRKQFSIISKYALLSVVVVFLISFIQKQCDYNYLILLILNTFLFFTIYVLLNYILKTKGQVLILGVVIPKVKSIMSIRKKA